MYYFYDRDSIEDYIKKYKGFINKVALKIVSKCPKITLEDANQQLYLYLIQNAGYYDPSKKGNMYTFYCKIIINASCSIIKTYWQYKNRAYAESISLDSIINDDDTNDPCNIMLFLADDENSYSNPKTSFIISEINDSVSSVLKKLKPLTRKVYRYYMQGKSVDEISRKLKMSKKTVYNCLHEIKIALKKRCESPI